MESISNLGHWKPISWPSGKAQEIEISEKKRDTSKFGEVSQDVGVGTSNHQIHIIHPSSTKEIHAFIIHNCFTEKIHV